MTMSKGAVGNLINRYRAVLKKCHMLNVFGSLAVAGMLVMGGAGVAGAQTIVNDEVNVQNETVSDSSGDLDGLVYKVNDNGKLSITGGLVQRKQNGEERRRSRRNEKSGAYRNSLYSIFPEQCTVRWWSHR